MHPAVGGGAAGKSSTARTSSRNLRKAASSRGISAQVSVPANCAVSFSDAKDFGSNTSNPSRRIGRREGWPGGAFSNAYAYALSCRVYVATLRSFCDEVLKSTTANVPSSNRISASSFPRTTQRDLRPGIAMGADCTHWSRQSNTPGGRYDVTFSVRCLSKRSRISPSIAVNIFGNTPGRVNFCVTFR